MYTILQNNPYKLADDIPGVGFKMADEIAAKIGIVADSDFRIKSGILYTLYQGFSVGSPCCVGKARIWWQGYGNPCAF